MNRLKDIKTIKKILLISSISICFLWGILVWNDTHLSLIQLDKYKVYANESDGYVMNIDNAKFFRDRTSMAKRYMTIDGWVIKEDMPFDRITIDVVLKNLETNDTYVVPTTMVKRTDITEERGQKYDWCGFRVKIPCSSDVNALRDDYEIMSRVKINDEEAIIVDSGRNTGEYK